MTQGGSEGGRGETLALLRQELATLREEIEARRQRLEELATVKEAEEAYAQRLAEAEPGLAGAQGRLRAMTMEKERLERQLRRQRPSGPPILPREVHAFSGAIRPPMQGRGQPVGTAPPAGRRAASDAGQRFKELANRWYAYWGMPRKVLSQINRIADDPTSVPGEALMMLEDSYFQGPVLPDETEEEQLERLGEWRDMLVQYRDQLAGEIDTQEIRYQNVMGIWEKWRTRKEDDAWEAFVTQTIQDRREEIEEKIADLEREITNLRAQLQALT